MPNVAILGDGGWGTAISLVLADNGVSPVMWGYDPAYLDEMARTRENPRFLPGIALPEPLGFTADLSVAVRDADLVVVAVPTKFVRTVFAGRTGVFDNCQAVVSLTKGIEQESLKRPSEVLAECTGRADIAVLSGPSHAEEVARRAPTTVTIAASDGTQAEFVQSALMTPAFRVYTSRDVVGVELGGALKNVIALAAGIAIGLDLGDNALAALMTRGLAEITRLGVALGADPLTFAGLSGMGDLITTCVSPHGRNRRVGLALGRGQSLDEILAGMAQVAEGVNTARGALMLGRRHGIELPITEQVCEVLYQHKDPRQAVADLMAREGKPESDLPDRG